MKKSRNTFAILSTLTCAVLTAAPLVLTSCEETEDSYTRELVLNTSGFKNVDLTEHGDPAYVKLTATYDNATVKLDTVIVNNYTYVSAVWNKQTQQLELTPLKAGNPYLTITATDENGHATTANASIIIKEAPIKNIVLDTSAISSAKFTGGGRDVRCKLTATVADKPVNIKTVNLTCSDESTLGTTWDGTNQEIVFVPKKAGVVTLTINAADAEGRTASETLELVVDDGDFTIDVNIEEDQNMDFNTSYDITATYGAKTVSLNRVEFTYGTSDILTASFNKSTQKITITPKNYGTTTLTIKGYDADGHIASKVVSMNVDSKIHKFINDRTFAVRCDDSSQYWFATFWLFYHETDQNKKQSEYTYYALTNNHVTSGACAIGTSANISFAYQDWDSARGESVTLGLRTRATSGNPNVYNSLTSGWGTSSSKFNTLFTTYLSAPAKDGTITGKFYRDMTICKIDFGDYANKPLATTRLNALNTYGNSHNNFLLPFDSYSDVSALDKRKIYAGGYPNAYLDRTPIYPDEYGKVSATKFQKVILDNMQAQPCADMDTVIRSAKTWSQKYSSTTVYNANRVLQSNTWLYSPEWASVPDITEKKMPFGGGASGSLGMYCTDPNDESTYRATGIYWGGMEKADQYGNFYFETRFSPFKFNFGKNMSGALSETDIIQWFMNSTAFTNNTPTDYCCYSAS